MIKPSLKLKREMVISLFNSGVTEIDTISAVTNVRASYVRATLQREGLIDVPQFFTAGPDDEERWNPYKETYPQFAKRTGLDVTARPDEPTDADLERLGNRAMGFLVGRYGYPQLDRFVNWEARPEALALEMAEFTYRLLAAERTRREAANESVRYALATFRALDRYTFEDSDHGLLIAEAVKKLEAAQDSTNTSEYPADNARHNSLPKAREIGQLEDPGAITHQKVGDE